MWPGCIQCHPQIQIRRRPTQRQDQMVRRAFWTFYCQFRIENQHPPTDQQRQQKKWEKVVINRSTGRSTTHAMMPNWDTSKQMCWVQAKCMVVPIMPVS